ncbi:conserved Plasmodium protein, unknown function [Babesia microti strain RI]|uniref:Uncharacterized protein n=1 Tax=Babesia microti (strain RI) TaxID=1133968 RepID=I7J5J5_BABMR|nr:conserved Plasmodium protein, unknown function [Babesia microti strain RI]CCF72937.1 conserved Plasmodium protein, unknown function [Babesia microti strain RI]|eukprot:XP_012647546.1 conserved Plasmodium protein, unknown function [Babesia microti strain RI]
MGRKELGISSKEYNDALVLERLFNITNKVKCSTCMLMRPSAVDFNSFELLCDTCSSRSKTVSKIGSDSISMRTVLELERKYKINDHSSTKHRHKDRVNGGINNKSPKGNDKHDKHGKHAKKFSENRKTGNCSSSISSISPIESDVEAFGKGRAGSNTNANYQMYDNPGNFPGMAGLMANNYKQSNPFRCPVIPFTAQSPNETMSCNALPSSNVHYLGSPHQLNPNIGHQSQYKNYSQIQYFNNPQQASVRLGIPRNSDNNISKNPFAQDVYDNRSHPRRQF